MAIIYLTENLFNKERNILPWRYIGSDQHNKSVYYGSNKKLKEDINLLGKEHFVKIILKDYGDIDNKTLRKLEATEYLKVLNVKKDDSYYNKSDLYAPGGGKKGMKHSKVFTRTDTWKESRSGYNHTEETKKLMAERKQGSKASSETKEKMSQLRNGEKNPNALAWDIYYLDEQIVRVNGLRAYCRDNNLSYYDIYHSRNGWKSVKHGQGKGGGRNVKK